MHNVAVVLTLVYCHPSAWLLFCANIPVVVTLFRPNSWIVRYKQVQQYGSTFFIPSQYTSSETVLRHAQRDDNNGLLEEEEEETPSSVEGVCK